MMSLSTQQVAHLKSIADASARGSAYPMPKAQQSRPCKFLKRAALVTENAPGELWITDAGKRALDQAKHGAAKPAGVA
jgi:hypothetical protein